MQQGILHLSRFYWRAEIRGLEYLPPGPCLLVGNHNAIAVLSPEIWLFGSHYFESHDQLQVLGHDLVLQIPGLARLARRYLQYIPNHYASAKQALQAGAHLLVFPGGGWEAARPSRLRDQIDFKGRTGFLRLAQECGVPIVPVVTAGGHDGVYIWKRGTRLARWLRLPALLRVDAFPLGFSFPLGLHLGPFQPFLPLPHKVILEVLPPIAISDLPAGSEQEQAAWVIQQMQATLARNRRDLSGQSHTAGQAQLNSLLPTDRPLEDEL